ncbi:MAG: AbgT family transporter [Gemmatimonadetes bacterium]|nr:AbgT family transporter [Gemmatimonadota bacterium]
MTTTPESASSPSPAPQKRTALLRFLDVVEHVGNALPDAATLFAILALLVVVVSALASAAETTAVHPATGETISAVNLMSGPGVRRMLTGAVLNFTAFPPLGLVIVVVIGIGVAERSGLVVVSLKRLVAAVPPSFLTATVVFAGIMSSMAVDAGYVVLTPLGAMVFAAVGRHPLAGLAAAFAGVSAGFSANLLLTSLDPLLSGISTEASHLVDPDYIVDPTANYYFMIVSVFLLTVLGTWVTTRFVERRMGAWSPSQAAGGEALGEAGSELTLGETTPAERRGMIAAGIVFMVSLAIIALLTVPANGMLRNPEAAGQPVLVQLRPFFDSIVALLMLMFLAMGIAYGIAARTIKSDRDVARMSAEAVGVLGSYIVLAFAAAQFIAWFNWSNLGIIVAIQGAAGLRALNFTGMPLLLSFIVVTAMINLFIGSASAKWAVMAPVFVPMLMLMGFSPELVQAAYRVGDSTTNIITPLMQYFPVILAFAQKYDRNAGIGTLISAMIPYSVVFFIGWSLLFTIWILVGLPLGPGAPMDYVPGG